MPEAFPGAIITFPMLGESFSLNPSGTYTLFGHTFYWYGAIIGLGFILAALYCMRRAPKDFGISKDTLTDVVLIGLPTAIVGARLYYVFCHWSSYVGDTVWQTLWNWCKIWEGGTAIPGGLLLATFCVWLYARKKKIPFGAIMDCVVLGLLIGQIIGRWSNFMNREYIGEVTDVFCRMGLTTGGTTYYVHPLFLYESLWNLVGFIFLAIWTRPHPLPARAAAHLAPAHSRHGAACLAGDRRRHVPRRARDPRRAEPESAQTGGSLCEPRPRAERRGGRKGKNTERIGG